MRYTLEMETGTYMTRYGRRSEWRIFDREDDKKKALRDAERMAKEGKGPIRVYDDMKKKTVKVFRESAMDTVRKIIREELEALPIVRKKLSLNEGITVGLTKVSHDAVKVSPLGPGGAYGVTHFMNFITSKVGVKATKLGAGEWLIHYRLHDQLRDSWDKKKVGDEWTITI